RATHDTEALSPANALVTVRAAVPEWPSIYLVHPAGGSVFCFYQLARHLQANVYALQDTGAAHTDLEAMARAYVAAMCRAGAGTARKPLYIGGYSFGATVAAEMARLLADDHQVHVERLVLLDAAPIANSQPTTSERWEDVDDLKRQGVLEFFEYFLHGEQAGME